jgi:tRNA nucleotidyltransferase/poly(A) polymerase
MEKMFKFYEVGGCVRDEILGLQSKDIDYVAVPNDSLLGDIQSAHTMFGILKGYLEVEGFEIFLVTDSCFTIRAKFPQGHRYQGVADFVMARKEMGYIPNTRQPIIVSGTLYDDLIRRDFTLNALAKDEDGNIIDYFNGLEDLQNRLLRTPLECKITFDDDPLRILRAIRFSITKGFTIPKEMWEEIYNYEYSSKMGVVSAERIREELMKCFKSNTIDTLDLLNEFVGLRTYIFTKTNLWLKPTMEDK